MFLGSCKENKSQPFNKALLQAILEAKDSLESNGKSKKLLSIQFYRPDRCEIGCAMKVFASDFYASGYVDAYAKIGNTIVAIYNLKDDLYETIDKNDITFFTDTIKGYKDTCVMFVTKKRLFYAIYKSDSIKRVSYCFDDFPCGPPIRRPRCEIGVIYKIPKNQWFYLDSLQAEKEVLYYRNRGKQLK
ncbi:hypothetical protein BSYN_14220 [Bacteroides sedimenti]|uniref:Lipoprotein n=2 Tax=Bacteroides sedimenti TaxID=2136147 RepID=A0ABN6Z3J9_9BACE